MPVSSNGSFYLEGGAGEPLVILLHGLSGSGAVWGHFTAILDRHLRGRWIAPDFAGHGRSPARARYGIANYASDISTFAEGANQVFVIGHSMGGLCAMTLASGWFGFMPRAVVSIGAAFDWGNEAKIRIDRLVDAPPRYFDTEAEARERFLFVNGLKGYFDPASDVAASGIRSGNGRWRLSADNRAAMTANANARKVYAAAECPVTLVRGENDPIVSAAELRSLDPSFVTIEGCTHNPHVERPDAIWRVFSQVAGMDGQAEA